MMLFSRQLRRVARMLNRDRLFSFVNIIGLSMGMISCAFIFLYTWHSLTFDTYHKGLDRIYRVHTSWIGSDTKKTMAITSEPVAYRLKENYEFIEAACRISLINDNPPLTKGNETFQTRNFREADRSVLDVFTFQFIHGSHEEALVHPGDLILNRSWAEKLFGTSDCVGETIRSGEKIYRVSGVYEDWPQNIDLPLNGLIAEEPGSDQWERFAYYTYVKTREVDHSRLTAILIDFSENQYSAKVSSEEYILLESQPLKGMHFSDSVMGDTPKGSRSYTYLFLAMGLILLLVILVNMSNLSIIRAIEQVQKTGLKKILGAGRWQLIGEHLLDITSLFIISLCIAITVFQLMIPYFTELTGIEISLKIQGFPLTLLVSLFLILVYASGLYAVAITSALKPVNALRKYVMVRIPGNQLRKALVVFQFVITGVLVSGLLILMVQWEYIKSKDLGFNPKGVLVVSLLKRDLNVPPAANELKMLLGEENVSLGSWGTIPGATPTFGTAIIRQNTALQELPVNVIDFDEHFLNVFRIPVLEGTAPKALTEEQLRAGMTQGVLINQSMADLIGKQVTGFDLVWMKASISGIVSDYHYESLHNTLEPLVLTPNQPESGVTHLFMRVGPGRKNAVQQILLKHWPSADFELEFMDTRLLANYEQERQAISLVWYFAMLSLFISALGLFGVVAYVLKRRIYEIGVRKVLGAGFGHLAMLFGREVLILLGIATAITFPMAVLLKDKLFGLYAFRPELNTFWLIVPSVIASVLAFLLIVIQIRLACRVNPSVLLRNE